MNPRQFVALDRDGTIIFERHYLSDPREVALLPSAADGLRQLRAMGLGLVVVTNQSAVGRGIIDANRLDLIHARMCELLGQEGISLDGIYHCPHVPEDNCSCRKPAPGMLHQAARELHFEPSRCFVIGDKPCDIELGQRFGAYTLLVRTGYGAQAAAENTAHPDAVVNNLQEAASVIGPLVGQNSV